MSCVLAGLASAQTFHFDLEGGQEVPPVVTDGKGTCTVSLDVLTGNVSVSGSYQGLSSPGTAAHIHGPAAPGDTAGVVLGLSIAGGVTGSVFGGGMLSPTEVSDLLAGLYYVNVHSTVWGDGELRGQIVAPSTATPYGGNPPLSLQLIGGEPAIGGSMILGVDNPLDTQPAGSLPFVAISNLQDSSFAATGVGLLLPGWGMSGDSGELLISVGGPNPIITIGGAAWAGAGNPAPIPLSIPSDVTLIGFSVYAQGVMLNPAGSGPVFGLTNGLELMLGQ